MAKIVEKGSDGHDSLKAGDREVIVLNPTGKRRSVPIELAVKLLKNPAKGFQLVDAGQYAKELDMHVSRNQAKN